MTDKLLTSAEWGFSTKNDYYIRAEDNITNPYIYYIKKDGKMKIIKPCYAKKGRGYYYVGTVYDAHGKQHNFFFHRVVAKALVPNPDNKTEVDHIDTDTKNYSISNLRWVTRSENNNNELTKQKRRREKIKVYKTREEKNVHRISVKCIDINTMEIVKVYDSIKDTERDGFNRSAVTRCCNHMYNREGNNVYKGYVWEFAE